MKRIFSLVICLSLIISILSMFSVCNAATPAYPADEVLVSQTVTEFADGSSVCITVSESPVTAYATKYSKNGTKNYTYRDSDGATLWSFSIHGTFTVTTGVSAVCTEASHSYNIVNTAWSYSSGSSYYTGNKAIGNGEFIRKVLFITAETKTCQVTLSCDANGTLS